MDEIFNKFFCFLGQDDLGLGGDDGSVATGNAGLTSTHLSFFDDGGEDDGNDDDDDDDDDQIIMISICILVDRCLWQYRAAIRDLLSISLISSSATTLTMMMMMINMKL